MPKDERVTPVGIPRPVLSEMRRTHRPLPPDASIEQMLHAFNEGMVGYAQLAADTARTAADYATLAGECKTLLAAIPALLERNYAEAKAARGIAEDVSAEVVLVRIDMQDLSARLTNVEIFTGLKPVEETTPVPPIRLKTQSNNDLSRHLSKAAMADIEAYRRNPSTPPGPVPYDVQEKLLEDRINAGLAIRDAARLQKAEEARLAREEQERNDQREANKADLAIRRDLKVRTVIAVLAIITAVVTIVASQVTQSVHNQPTKQSPAPSEVK